MHQPPARRAVWIDFENAPHVWVFSRVIDRLRAAGYPLILTARDFSCTVPLCRYLSLDVQVIGWPGMARHGLGRVLRVGERTLALYLAMFPRRRGVALALSHGSRSQIVACQPLGIPVLTLDDYEFCDKSVFRFVDRHLMPFPIPKEAYGGYAGRVEWYPGLKEDLYLCDFRPPERSLPQLPPEGEGVRVLLRPEGRFTHYRSAQSAVLQEAILEHLAAQPGVFLVLLPRDGEQGRALAEFCRAHHIACWLPGEVLDGPALIWQMDLVIGGGGTMTREAAALRVPSYSFFAGHWGAVDRHLQAQGRLVRIATVDDVPKIRLARRVRTPPAISHEALDFVTHTIEQMAV
jgi:predicted glycosyltransferase